MKIFIFMSILFVNSAFALTCESRLLKGGSGAGSGLFQIYIGDVSDNTSELMTEGVARNSIRHILGKLKCDENLKIQKLNCQIPFRYVPMICYAEVENLGGYFIITKDYVDHVNLSFNRWD
jgi:hypothetical protein